MNDSSPIRRSPCETKPVRILGLRLPVIQRVVSLLVGVALIASPVSGFWEEIHQQITRDALPFLRYELLEHIGVANLTNDDFVTSGDDEKHCDDCEFDGTSIFINNNYSDTMDWLGPDGDFDPWEAAYHFGRLTHPAQDFYSHSNWVELLELELTQGDDPNTPEIEVQTADLYDLSGAPYGNFQHWFEPSPIATSVRDGADGIDIRLDHDDMGTLPFHWSVDADGGGTHVPYLKDENGVVQAKLLNSGRSTNWSGLFSDEECDIWGFDSLYAPVPGVPGPGVFIEIRQVRLWAGFTHDELNKDGPTNEGIPTGRPHPEARALAVLQTSYEWCRLVYKAGLEGLDGLLLALWVNPDASPHPPNTPFAAATNPSPSDPTRGLKEITVTVESVKVLHSGDSDDNEPGEVNLSLVVYDSPFDFHRSVRSEVGPVDINSGEFVPAANLPAPLTLCLDSSDLGFTVALHGWDDDDETAFGVGDYDGFRGYTHDPDEVLLGFQQRFLTNTSGGTGTLVSRDLEVVYRVEVNTDRDADGLGDCDERGAGTDVADADTDDDGLTDGDEVNTHGTNPLVADSDGDTLGDGTEVALGTDPLDSDSDDDGLLDDVEVATDTDPLDPDSDGDGILDGQDVEFIQNVINTLPTGAFKNGAPGQRVALNSRLDAIEKRIESGQIAQAVRELQALRADLDGCGANAAPGDLIVDCVAQIQVRGHIDLLLGNLNAIALLGKPIEEKRVPAEQRLTVLSNPARGEVEFRFQLEREGECTLELFDLRGRRVDELRLGRYGAGVHAATWDPRHLSLASGIYFARLRAGAVDQTVRFVVAH